ncbi:Co2+/Mg2+ efflux protein ApaG [Ancylobacter mangrovi]|uniref:Co2+/Mg2+ efflux protein ApaG n=1 Tax=Ancylobacter mangrovi TaxID=2972472 RepID=UPI0021617F83|nr:Co2+/Mg2+ efflux protein ApaG [Ancylobacter mangrovi]MCS0503081.1 Co2+/Mg2+ efflux protein ApaG [Ancylobacter mangrovi]
MYRATTKGVQVTVTPRFSPERSDPERGQYFWAYTVEIVNLGVDTVQLKSRHWIITDALGRVQEVRGAGVVGEEPVLPPGAHFEYTSGVPLPTSTGIMEGSYNLVTQSGEMFDAEVPAFSLDLPGAARTLN